MEKKEGKKSRDSILGYNRRFFFPLWDTMEKNYTTLNDIFKF
jgi:hypothetical protein